MWGTWSTSRGMGRAQTFPFRRSPYIYLKGILLVRELLGEIAGLAEKRKVGTCRVRGAPWASPFLVVLVILP